jgi:hypothetical protein
MTLANVGAEPVTAVTNRARRLRGTSGSPVQAAKANIVRPEGVTKNVGLPGPIIPVALVSPSRAGAAWHGPRGEAQETIPMEYEYEDHRLALK